MTDNRDGGMATINIVQTVPSQITMHTIENFELEKLTNISRPISLTLAGVSAGAFFSFLPSALASTNKLNTSAFGKADLFYVIVTAIAALAMVYLGIVASRGEYDARQMVKGIKGRKQRPF